MGIGLTAGPLLNAIMYDHLGYKQTFLAYAAIIGFFGLGSTLFMPSRLNYVGMAEHMEETG
jgi:predicted MFS family arabinose efflux permease